MVLIDGKAVAKAIREKLAAQVHDSQLQGIRPPHLAMMLVGYNPASHIYVQAKRKACQEVGFQATLLHYPSIQEADLLHQIQQINENPTIDGLIVQMPLPPNISVKKVMNHIKPEKDVDGFHPFNFGSMVQGLPSHVPATPLGILMLLNHYQIETRGKHCVIIGRSRIVGSPLSVLLSRDDNLGNATVTLCHSHTTQLNTLTRQADILVTAIGQPRFVTASMVQEGAVVIDVGITRTPDRTRKSGYRWQGDVAFEQVAPRCSYITPVPGGVGPMTIAALLLNTSKAAQHSV